MARDDSIDKLPGGRGLPDMTHGGLKSIQFLGQGREVLSDDAVRWQAPVSGYDAVGVCMF